VYEVMAFIPSERGIRVRSTSTKYRHMYQVQATGIFSFDFMLESVVVTNYSCPLHGGAQIKYRVMKYFREGLQIMYKVTLVTLCCPRF